MASPRGPQRAFNLNPVRIGRPQETPQRNELACSVLGSINWAMCPLRSKQSPSRIVIHLPAFRAGCRLRPRYERSAMLSIR